MAENPPVPGVAAAAVDGAPLVGAAGAAAGPGAPPPPAVAEDPINEVLRTCGVAAQASRMIFIYIDGLDSLAAFTMMSSDTDVAEMAKRMASRPTAAGRVIPGMMQIKRIPAFVHWVKDCDKRGLAAEPDMWTAEVMAKAMERKEAKQKYEKLIWISLMLVSITQTMVGITGRLHLFTN